MNEVAVGVDVGSSGVRAVALDADGELRAWVRAPFEQAASWPAGWADPRVWLDGIEAVLAQVQATGAKLASIAIGGQSPTTVPVPRLDHPPSGTPPLRPGTGALGIAITCRNPIGVGLSRQDQHQAHVTELSRELGYPVAGAEIWDWAVGVMGAGCVQGVWANDELLSGHGEPVAVGKIAGRSDGTLGVAPGTPLVCGHNDAYMSFWGGGLGTPGRGHDPGGRTGGLGVAVAAETRPATVLGFPSPVAGVEVVGGPVNGHGELLDWWAAVSGNTISEVLAAAATVPAGAEGVVVLPYHDGERAPRWLTALRGEISNLSFHTSAAHIARAVLESAAYGLRHIRDDLEADGVAMDVMGCGGSPARSGLWCRIKASVLQVPVEAPERPEQLSAHGCALAAGAAIGWWPGVGADNVDCWPIPNFTPIEPTSDPAEIAAYEAAYGRFLAAGDAAAARASTSA